MIKDRFSPPRVGDYIIFCDICGAKCYASEATTLSTYTGHGGLLVCPLDVDPIDYGIVPYKIPAEQPVPTTRNNHYSSNPSSVPDVHTPFNAETTDPMSS